MATIVVSGVPGTGKSELAQGLAKKLKWKYVDVNKIIQKKKLKVGYDRHRNCYIVDEKKLSRVLAEEIVNAKQKKQDLVLDSHMGHFVPKKYVNLVIITKCELKTLERRLKKRGYKDTKIRENLDAEIFDVCASEAADLRHNILVVFTDKPTDMDQLLIRVNENLIRTDDPLRTITFTEASAKKLEKRGHESMKKEGLLPPSAKKKAKAKKKSSTQKAKKAPKKKTTKKKAVKKKATKKQTKKKAPKKASKKKVAKKTSKKKAKKKR